MGTLIGTVGIGGILLIPALTAFSGLGIHAAMATALFTFAFTGAVGTVMYQRRGSIDWRLTVPVCVAAVLFAYLGAWANAFSQPRTLTIALGLVILLAGAYALAKWRAKRLPAFHERPAAQRTLLGGIGAVAGFGSGFTGVGGPAISVPLMVMFGFPALSAVGTSQVIQIVAATSGSLAHVRYGAIDFRVAAIVTLVEIAGVYVGTRIAHAVNADALKRIVAAVCIVAGIVLMARAW